MEQKYEIFKNWNLKVNCLHSKMAIDRFEKHVMEFLCWGGVLYYIKLLVVDISQRPLNSLKRK